MAIWIITIIALIGTVLNAHQKRSGFLFWIVSNAGLSGYNFGIDEYAQSLLFFVYLILAIYGFINWGRPEENPVINEDGETVIQK